MLATSLWVRILQDALAYNFVYQIVEWPHHCCLIIICGLQSSCYIAVNKMNYVKIRKHVDHKIMRAAMSQLPDYHLHWLFILAVIFL